MKLLRMVPVNELRIGDEVSMSTGGFRTILNIHDKGGGKVRVEFATQPVTFVILDRWIMDEIGVYR